jgi:DNA polymerase sigma
MLNVGVNSYLWTLLVIFYLQHEQMLPPVKVLQDMAKKVYVDGWNTAFGTPNLHHLRIPQMVKFDEYLTGFFKFYGHQFDFTNYIICPLTGTRVPKHIFDHGKETSLPPVFTPYVKYMQRIDMDEANEIDDLFANCKPLVVQDPFELIHNVGKGIPDQKLMRIIHLMRSTCDVLTEKQPI